MTNTDGAKVVVQSGAAPDEGKTWQRVMDAIKEMARPLTIYSGGLGVFIATIHNPTPEVVMISAALTGAVGWMHGDTKVKMADIASKNSQGGDSP